MTNTEDIIPYQETLAQKPAIVTFGYLCINFLIFSIVCGISHRREPQWNIKYIYFSYFLEVLCNAYQEVLEAQGRRMCLG